MPTLIERTPKHVIANAAMARHPEIAAVESVDYYYGSWATVFVRLADGSRDSFIVSEQDIKGASK